MDSVELYLVTDRFDFNEKQFLNIIEESILGGTSIVQLREKSSSTRDFYNLALNVKKITDKYDIPLIINDRVDVALAVGASGVHLGQSDMPCGVARSIVGDDMTIGISTHTFQQSLMAERDGADYIGVGAIVETSTKTDAVIATHDELVKIRDNIGIPTVAIGGIKTFNAYDIVKRYGFDCVAVVSEIMLSSDPRRTCVELLDEINRV